MPRAAFLAVLALAAPSLATDLDDFGCRGVGSYPSWTFADGSRISGVASLAVLASRTGCTPGGRSQARPTRADPRDSWSGVPTRQRDVGGARIIEIR